MPQRRGRNQQAAAHDSRDQRRPLPRQCALCGCRVPQRQWQQHVQGIAHRRAALARRHFPGAAEVVSVFEAAAGAAYEGRRAGALTERHSPALAAAARHAHAWAEQAVARLLPQACGLDRFREAMTPFQDERSGGDGAVRRAAAALLRQHAGGLGGDSPTRSADVLALTVAPALEAANAHVHVAALAGVLATTHGAPDRQLRPIVVRAATRWPRDGVPQARLVAALAALCEACGPRVIALRLDLRDATGAWSAQSSPSAPQAGTSAAAGQRLFERVVIRAVAEALRRGALAAGVRVTQLRWSQQGGGQEVVLGADDDALGPLGLRAAFYAAECEDAQRESRAARARMALAALRPLPRGVALRVLAEAITPETDAARDAERRAAQAIPGSKRWDDRLAAIEVSPRQSTQRGARRAYVAGGGAPGAVMQE